MGYFDYSSTMVVFFATVVFVNIWAGILRHMYDYAEVDQQSKVITNGLVVFCMALLVYTISLSVLWSFVSFNHAVFIYLFGIMTIIHYIYGNVARGYGFNKLYALSGVVASLITMVFNILFIYLTPLRIESLYLSVIIGYFIQIFWIEWAVGLFRRFRFSSIDRSVIKALVRFCFPLSLGTLFSWLLTGFARYAIINDVRFGMEANGLYSIAGRFSALLTLISSSFILAWQELAFSQSEDEKDKDNSIYNRAIQGYSSFLTAGISVAIPAIALLFPFLINKQYADSYQLVPFLFTATGIGVFVDFYSQVFVALKRTKFTMIVYSIGALVNVVMIYVLLPRIGLHGAGIALLIANIVMISIQTYLANKITRISLFTRDLFVGLITITVSIVLFLIKNRLILIGYLLMLLILFLFLHRFRVMGLFQMVSDKIMRKQE